MHTPKDDAWIDALAAREGLPAGYARQARTTYRILAERIAAWQCQAARPLIVGLCGPQGSGKSTLAEFLVGLLGDQGVRAASVSLDDFYLGRAARATLARHVHPLLASRGVPGTHDVPAGQRAFDALVTGPCALPRFDKGTDEPLPRSAWPWIDRPQVLLFEGWCVGATAQPEGALAMPVNALERLEDPDGRWRHYVNDQLAGAYQAWFARIDRLILLAPERFERVLAWRLAQEHRLRARLAAQGQRLDRTMDDAAVRRFVDHFERLTRHLLAEMPARADITLPLDAERTPAEPQRWGERSMLACRS